MLQSKIYFEEKSIRLMYGSFKIFNSDSPSTLENIIIQ